VDEDHRLAVPLVEVGEPETVPLAELRHEREVRQVLEHFVRRADGVHAARRYLSASGGSFQG
jgi:hypothetical protein